MPSLFAQMAQRNNDDFNFEKMPPEMIAVMVAVLAGILLVALIVGIFFLLTLSKALGRCRPDNRVMEPGQVWLNLIPFVSLVWQFITVNRVAESLDREFQSRGWDGGDDFGRSLGTGTCILNLVSIIPYVGGCFALVGFITFIIYWVKIAGYSSQLAAPRDEYEDDRDDRRDDDRDESDGERERRPWDRR